MWQTFLFSPSFPLEVGPLIAGIGRLGSALAPPASPGGAEPGRQTVGLGLFGEFQAKNLASGSNNFQELFRK